MPSPTTAQQIIRDALSLTNAVGLDQTLSADELSDSLRVLNDLMEDWTTQNMAVYGQANQTFNTVAGQAVYTIGPGGDWVTANNRPERINDPAYSTINGVTFPCVSMTQGQYNMLAVKGQQQQFPDRYLYVNEFPLGLVTLWPVPNAITPITFSIDRILSQITDVNTSISFPEGYAKAFKYCLGVELAPLYGKRITDYPTVLETRNTTLGNIKRANKKLRVMGYDPGYLGSNRYTVSDFYRGY